MAIIKGVEYNEGMFVSITGMEVKNDNDIFVIDCDYAVKGKYAICTDQLCLKKVKLNGETSKAKYNLVFIDDRTFASNPNLKIEIITDLKEGKKTVNSYLKNRENKEIVTTFEESKDGLKIGSFIRFTKGLQFGILGEKYISSRVMFEVKAVEPKLQIEEVGKKGQILSTSKFYSFTPAFTQKIINENLLTILDKTETLKEELINNNEVAADKEVEEVKENNLLTIEGLKEGECIAVLKNKNNGQIKEVKGSYSEKFQCVYLIWQDPWEIIGYKQNVEDMEIIQEVEEPMQEAKENNNSIEEAAGKEEIKEEVKENNINVTVKFNEEKKGIELYFTDKPSQTILEGLKVNGFRWARYNKCWYIKDSEEARKYLNKIGFTGDQQGENIFLDSQEIEEKEVNLIEFDSIEQYTISEQLSKRENECHWVFRSKERNHTKEMQDHFNYCKEELIKALENTDNVYLKNNSIRFFNSYMKKYNDLFTKMIRNRADMPSVAVAGAGNYNYNRMNKNNDRYGNLLQEYTSLTNSFKDKIKNIKHSIRKEEDKSTFDKINSYKDNYKDLKLTKEKVLYNPSAVDNIFTGATSEINGYYYNDYYIIKNWGSFRIYDKQGNTVYIEKIPCSCATLKDAKLFLSYIIDNKNAA